MHPCEWHFKHRLTPTDKQPAHLSSVYLDECKLKIKLLLQWLQTLLESPEILNASSKPATKSNLELLLNQNGARRTKNSNTAEDFSVDKCRAARLLQQHVSEVRTYCTLNATEGLQKENDGSEYCLIICVWDLNLNLAVHIAIYSDSIKYAWINLIFATPAIQPVSFVVVIYESCW